MLHSYLGSLTTSIDAVATISEVYASNQQRVESFPPYENFKNRWVGAVVIQSNERFLEEAANIVEALCNLTYLICEEADHPGKVRHLASMSEERLVSMTRLLNSSFNTMH